MRGRFSIITRIREKRQGRLKSKRYGLELEIRALKLEIERARQYAKHPITLTSRPKGFDKAKEHIERMAWELSKKEGQLAAAERKLNK